VQAEWNLLFSWMPTTPRRVVVNASLHLSSTSLHSAWTGVELLWFQWKGRGLGWWCRRRWYAAV